MKLVSSDIISRIPDFSRLTEIENAVKELDLKLLARDFEN